MAGLVLLCALSLTTAAPSQSRRDIDSLNHNSLEQLLEAMIQESASAKEKYTTNEIINKYNVPYKFMTLNSYQGLMKIIILWEKFLKGDIQKNQLLKSLEILKNDVGSLKLTGF